jgi:putative SOS response-associated peptidase YedK
MCGRYSSDLRWSDIAKLYDLAMQGPPPWNFPPSYNICPTDPVGVIVSDAGQRRFAKMRWGVIPHWWAKPRKEWKSMTFNARAETVQTLKTFKEPFRTKRCLIPASGYYEWQDTPDGKQPYYFTRRDGESLTIAGVRDTWHDKAANENIESCAMVITRANAFIAEIHDRMPVILERDRWDTWMRTDDPEEAASLMQPAPDDVLQRWPVSRRVNSNRAPADDATLIKRVEMEMPEPARSWRPALK